MPKSRPPNDPEFRQKIIELHRGCRSAKSLAAGFGCTEQSVRNWSYHAWRTRLPSKRTVADAELKERIRAIHTQSRETYGAPRIHAELAAEGVCVGRKRVARLMLAASLEGASRRKWCTTTVHDERARPAPDLVDPHFEAPGPDQLWVADITYVPT